MKLRLVKNILSHGIHDVKGPVCMVMIPVGWLVLSTFSRYMLLGTLVERILTGIAEQQATYEEEKFQ